MARAPQTRGTSVTGVVLVVGALAAIAITAVLAFRTLDAASGRSRSGDTSTTDQPVSTTTTANASTTSSVAPTTTSTTPTTSSTSSTTSTTTTTTAPPAPSFGIGAEGETVEAVERRLAELGFFVPAIDGSYDAVTAQAVMAFQKSAGLSRDGIAGPQTLTALETAAPPEPREGGDHIEIDLERQLMFVVHGGTTLVLNTSTGTSGWRTPPGRFTITRQIDGMRHAPLGDLWRPKYFNGGIALHGSTSIPGHPASHGCARLHNTAIDHIWDAGLAPKSTPVHVY